MAASETVLSRSSAGAASMFVSSVLQRLIAFVLSNALLRHVSREVVGFAGSDMELLMSTVLFLSREACRLVALRSDAVLHGWATPSDAGNDRSDASRRRAQLVNLAWLPVPLGFTLALGAALTFALRRDPASELPGEAIGLYSFCASAALESLAEPAFILAQAALLYGSRARTEVVATLARCVVTYVLAAFAQQGVLAYAGGQVCFSVILFLGYWSTAGGLALRGAAAGAGGTLAALKQLLPAWLPASVAPRSGTGVLAALAAQVDPSASSLLAAFSLQTLVKHLLTEADRILLTALTDRAARGEFAVVQNYGSLPPRLLFAPLEEALRGAVSKLVGSAAAQAGGGDAAATPTGSSQGAPSPDTDAASDEGAKARLAAAARAFWGVLRLVVLLGTLAAVFGSAYARPAVAVLLGPWSGTGVPSLLALYAASVLAMAANGMTEAFANAAADAARVTRANAVLVGSFAAYAALAVALVPRHGAHALICLNAASMLVRTASAMGFVRGLLRRAGLDASVRQGLPRPATILVLAGLGAAAHAHAFFGGFAAFGEAGKSWQATPLQAAVQLAAGAGLGGLAAVAIAVLEGRALLQAYRRLRGKKE